MNFDLKKTKIFKAIKLSKDPAFKFAPFFQKLFGILFLIFLILFLAGYKINTFSFSLQKRFLGICLFFLPFFIFSWYQKVFFETKLKNPKLKITLKEALKDPKKYNLAEFLSFEVAKVILKSKKNTFSLFYHLLEKCPELDFIFLRINLSSKQLQKFLAKYLRKLKDEKENFEKVIFESLKIAQKKGHERVKPQDLLLALAKYNLIFQKLLIEIEIKIEDLENLISVYEYLVNKTNEQKKFWEWKNLVKWGSIARDWAAGFTITLDRFSIDLTRVVRRQGYPDFLGHEEELKEAERILARQESKNDVLIVGEKGSGRKSLVYALAVKSDLGESLPQINHKRFVLLNIAKLQAQILDPHLVELTLDKIFKEVISAKNVILVIDKFHNYVGQSTGPGMVNISGILSSYLHLAEFQTIAITTFEGLHRYIELNPLMLELFEKVEISEISEKETLILLMRLALFLERKYKKLISYLALRDIIKLSKKYLPAIPFPEKAIDLLEETIIYLTQTQEKVLLSKHVHYVIKERTKIPVGEIESKERKILLNLEKLIHQRLIDQEQAIKEICSALRRARTELKVRKGPMGSFLFLGPTGVGKTQTAKVLAKIYFGSEKRIIRLDMSEFQTLNDISRLLGSREQEGLLTQPVREKPFSLVLLDEFEKAHPNILNLFLQVLDEGHLTDGLGRKVNFKNTILICTSNAGYQLIFEAVRKNKPWKEFQKELIDYLIKNGIFRPELLNRFDAVVAFKPLSKENLLEISEILLKEIQLKLKEKGIDLIITQPLKEKIVELGFSPEFGARPMERVIQEKIGNLLAEAILAGKIKKGEKIEITDKFEIIKRY